MNRTHRRIALVIVLLALLAVGAALMNAMMAQAVADIVDAGGVPPVFVSANVDGGDEHNREMLKRYGSHIFYM